MISQHPKIAIIYMASYCVCAIAPIAAQANENIVGRPTQNVTISPSDMSSARAPARTLTSPTQLSEKIRSVLGLPNSDVISKAFGSQNHPFTTKNASAENDISPADKYPWHATGKLFMKFAEGTFVCTASVIGKGILVTAAHCVHNFGRKANGFAESISFEPARHDNIKPFGTWTGKEWWIPKAYYDGTDHCSTTAPGVVCENDLAVVVIDKRDEELIADVTGQYGFKTEDFGYANFFGNKAGQIAQLGYPADNFDGLKMVRTDSLGYQDAPNNVIIGSDQTGGSSGGPWLANFGMKTSHTGTVATDDESNQVVATTSWGFVLDHFKVQGASRFAKNKTYTIKSNIESLVEDACGANPGFC